MAEQPCTCGYPERPCLRVVLRNGPPFPPKPCDPVPVPPEKPRVSARDARFLAMRDSVRAVFDEIAAEVERALGKFPSFNSPHEGKAVIEEELEELWNEIKANRGREQDAMDEAVQIAAMAVRYVLDLAEAQPHA